MVETLGDIGLDGRLILKRIYGCGLASAGSRQDPIVGFYEQCSENWSSI
jgi:hypothetical protein